MNGSFFWDLLRWSRSSDSGAEGDGRCVLVVPWYLWRHGGRCSSRGDEGGFRDFRVQLRGFSVRRSSREEPEPWRACTFPCRIRLRR